MYENRNVYILHLSDLHIGKKDGGVLDPRHMRILSDLIDDVVSQLEIMESDDSSFIIAVSGDIIDGGDYNKNRDAVMQFFSDLRDKLSDCNINRVAIFIAPGNHDRDETAIYTNDTWDSQKGVYSPFVDMTSKIQTLFDNNITVAETYGVSVVDTIGGKICFLVMDTTHIASDDVHAKDSSVHKNYGRYFVGQEQLLTLRNQYQTLCHKCKKENKPIGLTIAITHLPLDWLTPMDEEICTKYFLSNSQLDVDVLMCGHIHQATATNYFKHDHSLLTLTTGVGKTDIQYSLYVVNMFNNSIDVIMRKALDGGFTYDYHVYADKKKPKDEKLRYPLKIEDSGVLVYIDVNTPTPIESRSQFVDQELIVTQLPKVAQSLSAFAAKVVKVQEHYAIGHAENNFAGYLMEICSCAVEWLSDCFSDDSLKGAYFKRHNWQDGSDTYHVQAWAPREERAIGEQAVMEYGGLIKVATETRRPAIYSANRRHIVLSPIWDDFMTLVPDFAGNVRDITVPRDGKSVKLKNRPILTFGLSIKNGFAQRDTRGLYLLAHLGLDKVIEMLLDDFIVQSGKSINELL